MKRAILDGGAEWKKLWRETRTERRRQIKHAVRAGEGLPDDVDAALAVGLARRWLRQWWLMLFDARSVVAILQWRSMCRRAVGANLSVAERVVGKNKA